MISVPSARYIVSTRSVSTTSPVVARWRISIVQYSIPARSPRSSRCARQASIPRSSPRPTVSQTTPAVIRSRKFCLKSSSVGPIAAKNSRTRRSLSLASLKGRTLAVEPREHLPLGLVEAGELAVEPVVGLAVLRVRLEDALDRNQVADLVAPHRAQG